MLQIQTNRDLNSIKLDMASNWADNQTTNGTVGGNGEVSPVVPESLIQVSEIRIFILWVLIQSFFVINIVLFFFTHNIQNITKQNNRHTVYSIAQSQVKGEGEREGQ